MSMKCECINIKHFNILLCYSHNCLLSRHNNDCAFTFRNILSASANARHKVTRLRKAFILITKEKKILKNL